MSTVIKPLRRTGSSGVPNVANMQEGEIAVNSFDQKIWMRVGDNLVEIANASTGGGGGAPTVVLVNTAGTLGATHLNSMCEKTSADNTSLTLPPTYGTPGDAILFVNNSTGNLTITRGSGVTLMSYGSNTNLTIPANRAALLVRTSTANKWVRA